MLPPGQGGHQEDTTMTHTPAIHTGPPKPASFWKQMASYVAGTGVEATEEDDDTLLADADRILAEHTQTR